MNLKPGKEEEGFERALSTLHENVALAGQYVVTFHAFFDAIRYDSALEEAINDWRRYWNMTLHGWQAGLFFSLGRIYDNNGYGLKQIFNLAKKHRSLFSLDSLASRKATSLSKDDVDSYMQGRIDLSGDYLDTLAKEAEDYRDVYKRACKKVRDSVYAHSLLAESGERSAVFRSLDDREIFTLAVFAKEMDRALFHLFHNGDALPVPLALPDPPSPINPSSNQSWQMPDLDQWQLADQVAELMTGIRNLRRSSKA